MSIFFLKEIVCVIFKHIIKVINLFNIKNILITFFTINHNAI